LTKLHTKLIWLRFYGSRCSSDLSTADNIKGRSDYQKLPYDQMLKETGHNT